MKYDAFINDLASTILRINRATIVYEHVYKVYYLQESPRLCRSSSPERSKHS